MEVSKIQNLRFKTNNNNVSLLQSIPKYQGNKAFTLQTDTFQKANSDVTFTGKNAVLRLGQHLLTTSSKIHTRKEFKELARNRVIHCFYCQKPVFSPGFVNDLNTRGIFDGTIADFVKEIAPYKSYLKPTSYDIFKYIENTSQLAPQTHLAEALQILNTQALQDLTEKQLPIFKKIENEFQQLPDGIREKILNVLKIHKNRLKRIPQYEEFSAKDFSYKIKKASETVTNNLHRETLSNYAETILATTQTKYSNFYDNSLINRTFQHNKNFDYRMPVNIKSIQLYLVEQIKRTGTKLDRNDILVYCKMAEDMLLGKKVQLKFSNKAFYHDIEKVLNGYKNSKIKKKIFKAISKLPTSSSNVNSFIAKHEYSSSATIGYELLKPSITTIEHLEPESTHSPYVNRLGNYAHACGPCNHARADSNMAKYIEGFPQTSPQVYFNDMIGIVNDGFISLEDLLQLKTSIYRQSGRQMNASPISTKILAENFPEASAQEKFDYFIELANEDLISSRDIFWLQQELRKRCGIVVKANNLNAIFY